MKINLKKVLKTLKINESAISMILGALVIIVVVAMVANYFKEKGVVPENGDNKVEVISKTNNYTYKVLKGDNLWKIAEKETGSGFNWKKIAEENNLENPNKIEVDQKLKISVKTENPFLVEKSDAGKKVENVITGATYEVVKGDTLWDIAVRAYGDGYKWVEIARENKLDRPSLIHPGNLLALPR